MVRRRVKAKNPSSSNNKQEDAAPAKKSAAEKAKGVKNPLQIPNTVGKRFILRHGGVRAGKLVKRAVSRVGEDAIRAVTRLAVRATLCAGRSTLSLADAKTALSLQGRKLY